MDLEDRMYEHVSRETLLLAAVHTDLDHDCDTCHENGDFGYMINAGQWINCPACNPTE